MTGALRQPKALEAGMDVAVANVFAKIFNVEKYVQMAQLCGCENIYVYHLKGTFKDTHNVPAGVLKSMASGFEPFPGETEVVLNGEFKWEFDAKKISES